MQATKSIFLLIFSLLTISPLINAQIQRYDCDISARPKDCVSISIPVCAFPRNCNDFACARTAVNSCQACSALDILSYSNGACPIVIPEEEDNSSTVVQPPEEEEQATPSVPPTEVCPTGRLIQFFGGRLIEGAYCCGKRNNACTWDIAPVCATLYECVGSVCRKTLRNPCRACKDLSVDYYFPIQCPENPVDFQPVVEESDDQAVPDVGGGTEAEDGQEGNEEQTAEAFNSEEERDTLAGLNICGSNEEQWGFEGEGCGEEEANLEMRFLALDDLNIFIN